jgi:hypothetical protein
MAGRSYTAACLYSYFRCACGLRIGSWGSFQYSSAVAQRLPVLLKHSYPNNFQPQAHRVRPNHFIERTVSGMLRMPPTSAHVER